MLYVDVANFLGAQTPYAQVSPAVMRPTPFTAATLPKVVNDPGDNWFDHVTFDTDEAQARFLEIAAYRDSREALAESLERMEVAQKEFWGVHADKTRRGVRFIGFGRRVLGGKRLGGPDADNRRRKHYDPVWGADTVAYKDARRDKGWSFDWSEVASFDTHTNEDHLADLTAVRDEVNGDEDDGDGYEIAPALFDERTWFDEVVSAYADPITIVVVLKDGRTLTYADDKADVIIVANDEPDEQFDGESPEEQLASVMNQMVARSGNPARSIAVFDLNDPDYVRHLYETRPVAGLIPGTAANA